MSDNNSNSTPWWKQPKNITWMGIIAVFLIATVLIGFGLRGSLQPSGATDGYIDAQELEEQTEVEVDPGVTIQPALLEAGYVVPKNGPFCDDEGNVLTEWERIYVEYGDWFTVGDDVTAGTNTYAESDVPSMFIQHDSFRIVKAITPVVDISKLAIEGVNEAGIEYTETVDLTKYTDPATNVVFVDGCNLLPHEMFSRAFDVDGPPFLHRINEDGTVNIAQIYWGSVWMADEQQPIEYSAVSMMPDVISDESVSQEYSLYYPGPAQKDATTYVWIEAVSGMKVFRGDDRDDLFVPIKTAPPAGKKISLEYYDAAVVVPNSESIDPVQLYDEGFCFGDYKNDLTVTRTVNPDPSLLPEGVEANVLITDNYYDPNDMGAVVGPCYWLHATIIDK